MAHSDCDQCEYLYINGVGCHELRCPNRSRTKVNGEWIMLFECPDCGTMYQAGTHPECSEEPNPDGV